MDPILILMGGLVLVLYFLPSFAAIGKKNAAGVLTLNFFLGWTLIGWVVSAAWALSGEPVMPKKSILILHRHDGTAVEVEDDPRYCPYCGAHILIDAPFCRNCGRKRP